MTVFMYSHTTQGGHRRYVEDLAAGLSAHATVVILTAPGAAKPPAGVAQHEVLFPVDVRARGPRRLVSRVVAYLAHSRQLGSYLRARPGSAAGTVHFQELPTLRAVAAVRAVQRRGLKAVVTVHNVVPHTGGAVSRLTHSSHVRAWRAADLLIVHSTRLKGQLLEQHGLPASRVAVIPHAVWSPDGDGDGDGSDGADDLRPELRDYLFFGHLRESKGPEGFLTALARLDRTATASIVGSGTPAMEQRLKDRIDELGLTGCRLDNRFVDDAEIPGIFRAHRVLVAPYQRFEAQSGVTHLAVTYGLAQVVTPVGALPDLVRRHRVGVVARSTGAAEVADAMRAALELCAHAELRTALASARDELSSVRVGQTLWSAYSRLASVDNDPVALGGRT